MTDQEKKLNEKLARWRFGESIICSPFNCAFVEDNVIVHKGEGKKAVTLYSGSWFTDSLDTCFEQLVPKVEHSYELTIHVFRGHGYWTVSLSNLNIPEETIYGSAKSPALALCLAIEKLIDTRKIQ